METSRRPLGRPKSSSSWLGYLPLIVVLTVGFAILAFARPLSRWFAANREAYNGKSIGQVIHAEGSVRHMHQRDISIVPSPTLEPVTLHDGDGLQSSVQSKADFSLLSNDELELSAGSAIKVQLADPNDAQSTIFIQVLFGHLNLRQAGLPGRAYVIQDERLYLPGQRQTSKALGLIVHRTPLLRPPAEPALPTVVHPPPAPSFGAKILANEYVDVRVSEAAPALQKCWNAMTTENSKRHAHVEFQWTIASTGAVVDLSLLKSSLADEAWQTCVLASLAHLTFASFLGEPMEIVYPVDFE